MTAANDNDDSDEVDVDVYVNALTSALNLFAETWKAAVERDPSIKAKLPINEWEEAFYSFVEKAADEYEEMASNEEE